MNRVPTTRRPTATTLPLTAIAILLACAASGRADEYRLVPGDTVSVVVQRHPEMSLSNVVVPPDGVLQVPVAGAIRVAGMTASELTATIDMRLRARLRAPEVSVQVRQARPDSVFVLGVVKSPGAYPLGLRWRVTELLAAAGGVSTDPRLVAAALYRSDGSCVALDLPGILAGAGGPELRAGDVLSLTEQVITVTVAGAVTRPGTYRLPIDAGPMEAIAQAGGPAPRARLGLVTIDHAAGGRETIDLAPAMIDGAPAPEVVLQNGDTIVIPRLDATIAVLGAVARGGSFPIDESLEMRVSDALALAGGLSGDPSTISGAILRRGGERIELDLPAILTAGSAAANLALREGDVLSLARRTIKVRVAGQVSKPGAYELPLGAGVLAAIAEAQGVTDDAGLSAVAIRRADGSTRSVDLLDALINGQGSEDMALADQDLVIVPEARAQVAVLGGVRTPGVYDLREGAPQTVTQLIAEAGGAVPDARLRDVGVVRRGAEGPERISVNVTQVLREGATEADITVRDQDVIFVPVSASDWDTVFRAITSGVLLGRWLLD